MTLDHDDLDDRQLQLLDVLTREFEEEPLLDSRSGAALYQRLRRDLTASGATETDFEFLTGELVRLIIESGNPFTPRHKATQLTLVSGVFAQRSFQVHVDRGVVQTIDFSTSPTTH